MADDDLSLGAEIASAMGSTSTQSAGESLTATGDSTAQQGTGTTDQAAGTPGTSTDQTTKQGPIPFEVHHTALENARTKAVAEKLSEYGLERFQPDQLKTLAPYLERASRDPEEFLIGELLERPNAVEVLQKMLDRVKGHPTHGQAINALIGRAMQQLRAPRTSEAEEPQLESIPVALEDGRTVQLVTADSAAKREAWVLKQAQAQTAQQVQPFQQLAQTWQDREKAAEVQRDIDQYVAHRQAEIPTWPGMADPANVKAWAEHLATMPVSGDDPRAVDIAAYQSYLKVVVPRLHASGRQSALQDTHLKASVTGVMPQTSGTGTPKDYRDMSWSEAFKHEIAARR